MLKRYFVLVSLILSHISFVYPNFGLNSVERGKSQILKSRIIIIGRSSIIIESKDNNTNIIASKIETVSGGKLKRIVVQDDEISKNVNDSIETGTEASASFDNGLPTEFVIEKAYPNPFNSTTTIRYACPTFRRGIPVVETPRQVGASVHIAIYDMTGRLVSDYNIGEKTPGWHEFTWQGTDSHGQQVSTGIYLVTMRAGEYFQKQKVTFLK